MLEPVSGFFVGLSVALGIIAGAISSISTYLASILASLIAALAAISGFMAAIASVLPLPEKKGVYSKVHFIVNRLAFNVGMASNRVAKIDGSKE